MSGLGMKRAAEDRVDREGKPDGEQTTTSTASNEANAAAAPAVTFVKRGPRAEDAPTNNPFKGLATTSSGAEGASPAASGFGGFGAAASTGFGAFASSKPTAAETATAAAASKFSFSFGAPAATAAAPVAAATTAAPATFSFNFGAPAAAAPAAPTAAATTTTTAAPATFSFNFGASSAPAAAAPAPTATATAAPSAGGFSFGTINSASKFDFGAGVKAFAAAQTARSADTAATTAAADAEEDVDPSAEEPAIVEAPKENALSKASVKATVTGDESDEVHMEIPHTKVFILSFKTGTDGKKEKEWKERGDGTLKVSSYDVEGVKHHRVTMHSSQTKQVVLNVSIDKWFAVTGSTDKSVAFRTVVVEGGKPTPTMYSLKVNEAAAGSLAELLKDLAPKKE